MDHMKLETPDLTAQNIEKIGALFPNCVTETVDENGISLRVDGKPYAALLYSNEKFYYVDENHEVTVVNKLMDSAIDDTEGGSTS